MADSRRFLGAARSVVRALRAHARWFALLAVALSVLTGTVRAQTAVFVCRGMVGERLHPCCRHEAPADAPVLAGDVCCHRRVSPPLPASTRDAASGAPLTPPAPLVAILRWNHDGASLAVARSPAPRFGGIPPPPAKARTILRI